MTPRFFTCSVADCEKPSVRGTGGCDSCQRYLCVTHKAPEFHTCDDVNPRRLNLVLTNSHRTRASAFPDQRHSRMRARVPSQWRAALYHRALY
ncbi:hypothetical protein F4777DRAFT_371563 [Nemania sp. FL0916]|nr:hypothetical protein F4777DRAFT_371563 [Nemania sp. FL0916]